MAFHKCWRQMISFAAIGGAMIMRSSTQFDFELTLTNSEGQKSKIKLKPTNEPNKGLGFLIAPTANQKPDFNLCLEQTE